MDQLKERGIQSVLIEGGGDLIYQFFKAGLIHEMYVTLCPKLMGLKGAPTLCDGLGFIHPKIRGLKLADHRVVGDEIFLKYFPAP